MTTDKNMLTATNTDVRYTMDSVRAIESIKDHVGSTSAAWLPNER